MMYLILKELEGDDPYSTRPRVKCHVSSSLEVFQVFEQDPHSTEERDCKLQHMLDSGKYRRGLIWDDYRQNITWEQIRKLEILNKFSIFIYKMTSFIN